MEAIIQFFLTYGWPLGCIALGGVVVLGVLKYCNVFEKIGSDTTRHLIYCGCSVGLTLIGIIIYLVCTAWDWTAFLALVPVVWALNQAMYNLFKVTKLNDLAIMVLNLIKKFIIKDNSTTESK